jgi:hypothetical protein
MTPSKASHRLVQPISKEARHDFILRPGAFFWRAGRLHVGYAWLSSMHHGDKPFWDPIPVKVGTIIETVSGFYQFTGVLREGPPYKRQYAQLQFAYLYRPDDSRYGFIKNRIDQGEIPIHEKYVLEPNTYMEAQWLSRGALLHKFGATGQNLERFIQRQKPLVAMRRAVSKKLRAVLDELYGSVRDRERMIRRFALKPQSCNSAR